MACAEATSIVWGTGVMHPDVGLGRPKQENIYAIRGKLSAEALRASGLLCREIPPGDPSFLAPKLFGIEGAFEPRFPLGIVPHYVDRSHLAVKRLLAMQGVSDLDMRKGPQWNSSRRCRTAGQS